MLKTFSTIAAAMLLSVLAIGGLLTCQQTLVYGDSGEAGANNFSIQSSAFDNGAWIPTKFTADGQNLSPPLSWSGAPKGTQSFAIIVSDPDAPGAEPFTHWVIFNIPATVGNLPENITNQENPDQPAAGVQGNNSFGQIGYGGPSPPPGPAHHYHFTIYALDATMNLQPGCSADDLTQSMQGHILAQTELVGCYGR